MTSNTRSKFPAKPTQQLLAGTTIFSNSGGNFGHSGRPGQRGGSAPKDTRQQFESVTDRKPTSWAHMGSINWESLTPDQQAAIASKPKVDVSSSKYPLASHPAFKGSKANDIEYLAKNGSNHFYVNTEGADYARYAVKINNLPDEHKVGATPAAAAPVAPVAPAAVAAPAAAPTQSRGSWEPKKVGGDGGFSNMPWKGKDHHGTDGYARNITDDEGTRHIYAFNKKGVQHWGVDLPSSVPQSVHVAAFKEALKKVNPGASDADIEAHAAKHTFS